MCRPTPEEAAQWRESLDRVLNNSCTSTFSFTHSLSLTHTIKHSFVSLTVEGITLTYSHSLGVYTKLNDNVPAYL